MKSKTIWIIVAVVVLILIIGYFTNWFGLKKPSATNGTAASRIAQSIIVNGNKLIYFGTGLSNQCPLGGHLEGPVGQNEYGQNLYKCYVEVKAAN